MSPTFAIDWLGDVTAGAKGGRDGTTFALALDLDRSHLPDLIRGCRAV